MAYEIKPQDDEQQQGQDQGAITGTAAAPSAQAPSAPTSPQGAGGYGSGVPNSKFVNFDRLLSANKDVANREADTVASGVEDPAKTAQNDFTMRSNAFNSAVSNATPGYLQNAAPGSAITGQIDSHLAQGQGTLYDFNDYARQRATAKNGQAQWHAVGSQTPAVAGVAAAAPGMAKPSNPNAPISKEEAQTRAAATYGGPKGLSDSADWAEFYGKANDAAQRAVDLGTGKPGNLQAEIQKQMGVGQSDSGFDAALTGAVGQPRFGQMADKFAGFEKTLGAADSNSQAKAAAAAAATKQGADYWKGKVDERNGQEAEQNTYLHNRTAGFGKTFGLDNNQDRTAGQEVQNEIARKYGDDFYFKSEAEQQRIVSQIIKDKYPNDASKMFARMAAQRQNSARVNSLDPGVVQQDPNAHQQNPYDFLYQLGHLGRDPNDG